MLFTRLRNFAVLLIVVAATVNARQAQSQWADPVVQKRHDRLLKHTPPINSIIVKFRGGMTVTGLQQLRLATDAIELPLPGHLREVRKLGAQVLKLNDPTRLYDTLDKIRAMPQVQWAEPNYRVYLLSDPNDTYFGLEDFEHALFPPDDHWPYQWNLQFIQASAAWSIYPSTFFNSATKPRNAVKVAVIDTGVDMGHPDFINAGGGSTDARFGGQLDVADSYNMLNGGDNSSPDDPGDDYGHGTHVAGIIGAATNNLKGVAAIGHTGQVMVLKVTDPSGDGDDADVADAMVWAADHGALVLNLSLAVNGGFSQLLQEAVNYCWDHNVLVVAAAGNDGVDYVRRYPAACNKVLAVAATTFASVDTIPSTETQASYSNQGLYIGIGAPGGDATYFNGGEFGFVPELNTLIWSTTPTYDTTITLAGITEYTYGYLNGTSMASPHVAGLATLYAGYKGFTQATANAPRRIIRAIQRGADNIAGRLDGGWTIAVGHGRINALATLQDTFGDGRDTTTPGCITGQVTYFGTVVTNAFVTAIRTGTTRRYGANSKEDGTYRIANVGPGVYNVAVAYHGITKIQTVTVEAGCDTIATDFDLASSNVTIAVTPHTATVILGKTTQLSATVSGTSNTTVVWSVADGPGTVSSTGLYTAPTSTATPAVAHVRATSVADGSKFDTAEITIPTGISTLTLSKTSTRGGTSLTGTVTLSGPAPAGGAVVTLAAANTALVVLPATVTVAEGTTSVTFNIATNPTTTDVSVNVTATYLGVAKSVALKVLRTVPSTLSYSPNPVVGGNPSTTTLTLNGVAPSGGLTVTLTSDNPGLAMPPSSVTIPAGGTSTTFVITTTHPTVLTTVLISAVANTVTVKVGLKVKP